MMIDSAQELVKARWKIIAVHGFQDGRCTCGSLNCKKAGKHPATAHGYKDATDNLNTIQQLWEANPHYNPAIPTGTINSIFVLEVESDGSDDLRRLEQQYGELPETLTVRSGGGSMHYYWNYPDDGTKIRNRQRIDDLAIDCRGEGGYVVAPGALHVTGNQYEWLNASPIVSAPNWVIEFVTSAGQFEKQLQQAQQTTSLLPNAEPVPEDVLDRARKYLVNCPPAINGQGGHNQTITVALRLVRGFDLPLDVALTLIQAWNQTCQPPWTEQELIHKLTEADREDRGWGPRGQLRDREDFARTDLGNAERLVHKHGENLRYCHPWQKWLVWEDCRWRVDDTAAIERLAKESIRDIYAQASDIQDDEKRRAVVKHACKSESLNKIRSMIVLTSSECGIPVRPDCLDSHPLLLNCSNGTVDLENGTYREHRRRDLLTKVTPIAYDPSATCPEWVKFLSSIFDGDDDLVGFVQRLFGYCLTGDVREQILPIFWGPGSNGKSTLLETAMSVLGTDYSMAAPQELLLANRKDAHPTAVADLKGMRLVTVMESDQGRRLNESLVKQLTGGDTIRARRMREDYWQFSPTHKLILCTNHRPEVQGTDHAIWRRVPLIPFGVRFWDGDKGETGPTHLRADKTLSQKLRSEYPGILTWAIRGCLWWLRDGLQIPQAVLSATQEYKAEQDILGTFLDDSCIFDPNGRVGATQLYEAYQSWCGKNGESHCSQRQFGQVMTERGFQRQRSNGTWYVGVQLNNPQPVSFPFAPSSLGQTV